MIKNICILISIIIVLCACGSEYNGVEKIHGKWIINKYNTINKSKEFGKMSNEKKKEFSERILTLFVEFDILSKCLIISILRNNIEQNRIVSEFKVTKDKGDYLELKVNKREEVDIKILNDNEIIMKVETQISGLDSFVLERKN